MFELLQLLGFVQPSERVAAIEIMGNKLKLPLKPIVHHDNVIHTDNNFFNQAFITKLYSFHFCFNVTVILGEQY